MITSLDPHTLIPEKPTEVTLGLARQSSNASLYCIIIQIIL